MVRNPASGQRWPTGSLNVLVAIVAATVLWGCAAQRLDLQPASDPMIEAVSAATSGQNLPSSSNAPRTGFSVGRTSSSAVIGGGPSTALPCTTQAASVLEALGFTPDQVRSVSYERRTSGGGGEGTATLKGYRGWVNFTDRSGHLVISFRTNCRFNTFYTRAGLELPTTQEPSSP